MRSQQAAKHLDHHFMDQFVQSQSSCLQLQYCDRYFAHSHQHSLLFCLQYYVCLLYYVSFKNANQIENRKDSNCLFNCWFESQNCLRIPNHFFLVYLHDILILCLKDMRAHSSLFFIPTMQPFITLGYQIGFDYQLSTLDATSSSQVVDMHLHRGEQIVSFACGYLQFTVHLFVPTFKYQLHFLGDEGMVDHTKTNPNQLFLFSFRTFLCDQQLSIL